MGCRVGLSVGVDVVGSEVVGTTVGLDVAGVPVGADVGSEVVGAPVGAGVGSEVTGVPVGTEVAGAPVGAEVGSEVVGAPVGARVGSEVVGAPDGAEVGSEVVGASVGQCARLASTATHGAPSQVTSSWLGSKHTKLRRVLMRPGWSYMMVTSIADVSLPSAKSTPDRAGKDRVPTSTAKLPLVVRCLRAK